MRLAQHNHRYCSLHKNLRVETIFFTYFCGSVMQMSVYGCHIIMSVMCFWCYLFHNNFVTAWHRISVIFIVYLLTKKGKWKFYQEIKVLYIHWRNLWFPYINSLLDLNYGKPNWDQLFVHSHSSFSFSRVLIGRPTTPLMLREWFLVWRSTKVYT